MTSEAANTAALAAKADSCAWLATSAASLAIDAASSAAAKACALAAAAALAASSGAGTAGVPRSTYFFKDSASSRTRSLYIKPKVAIDKSKISSTHAAARDWRAGRLNKSASVAVGEAAAKGAGPFRVGSRDVSETTEGQASAAGVVAAGIKNGAAGGGDVTGVGGGTKVGKGVGSTWGSCFLPKPGTRHAVLVGKLSNLETEVASSLKIGGSDKNVGSFKTGSGSGVVATQSVSFCLGSPASVSTSHFSKFLPKASSLLW